MPTNMCLWQVGNDMMILPQSLNAAWLHSKGCDNAIDR